MGKLAVKKAIDQGAEIVVGGPTKEELIQTVSELQKNQNAEMVDPKTLITREPFVSLWKIHHETKEAIVQSMKEDGFDNKQPIIVWPSPTGNVILDGHTRRESAIEAGLEKVGISTKQFDTEDDAYVYAVKLQFNRRNLDDSDIFRFVLTTIGKDIPGMGKRRERLAKLFSVSTATAQRALMVARYCTDEDKELILQGVVSIHSVFEKLKEEKNPSKGDQMIPPAAAPNDKDNQRSNTAEGTVLNQENTVADATGYKRESQDASQTQTFNPPSEPPVNSADSKQEGKAGSELPLPVEPIDLVVLALSKSIGKASPDYKSGIQFALDVLKANNVISSVWHRVVITAIDSVKPDQGSI